MAKLDNVRISLKIDDLSNWNNSSVILNDGEVALIRCPNNILKIKVGDGKTEINDLKYFNENFETINQGISNIVDDKNLVAGFKLSALGDFQSVFGFNAEALSTDTFSFIWNGSSIYNYNNRYKSHGLGSFQINPNNGLSGFWIGEQNMAQLLDKLYVNGIKTNTLSIQHISQDDYHELVTQENVLSNVLYIISSDYLNAYNEQIKNVAEGIEDTDGVNLKQVNDLIKVETDRAISAETKLDNKITEVDSKLDDFALKTDLNNLDEKIEQEKQRAILEEEKLQNEISSKIKVDNSYISSLNIQNISQDDYHNLVVNNNVDKNVLYIVSSDYLNAYGQQVQNVADAIKETDGVNLKQVNDLIKVETDRAIDSENELDNKIAEVDSKLDDFALKTDITEIENDLSNKIKVDGNNIDALNIQKISRDDYHNLVLDEAVDNNTLYIISSDNLNAYGQQIKNVAEGIEDSDAVNYKQFKILESTLINLSSIIGNIEEELNSI